ncbi:hypothetical protein KHQ81_09325 [Mycoplasmatota bacterium]|nr:hypothetical protein KHQ81_09325 [Mycoplasmatota bacterium]
MKKIIGLFTVLSIVGFFAGCRKRPVDSGLNDVMIQEVDVRKALSIAINKGYYTDVLLANGSFPADYFVPFDFYSYNGVDFRDASAQKYPELESNVYTMPDGSKAPAGFNHYDVVKAKELWETAKERHDIGDKTVTFRLLVHSSEAWTPLYEHIKAEVEKNLPGAIIDLNVVTFGEKLQIQQTGDFDIIFSGWGPDYSDPITFLDLYLSDSGLNNIKYNNPTYDKLVNDAKTAVITGEERFNALLEAEKILVNDDVVVMPIFQSKAVSLTNTKIDNLWGQKVGPDYFYKWVVSNKINDDGTFNKTLNLLGTSNIPDLKSWTAQDQVSFFTLGSINEGLTVSHNPKGATPIVEGAAENWDKTTNEDGTVTYTFHLRRMPWVTSTGDVYTVDGQPQYVKAQDFVFGWRMLADPREASPYQYMLDTIGLVGSSEIMKLSPNDSTETIQTALDNMGIEAVDDNTLNVTLSHDSTYFLGLMSFPSFYPVNEQFYNAQGTDEQGMTKYATSQHPETVLYNGPFYFSTWKNDDKHIITKNTHYWDVEQVDLNQVVWLVKPNINPETEVQLYLQGQIDRAVLRDSATQASYASRPDAKIGGSTTAWYLEFNVANH